MTKAMKTLVFLCCASLLTLGCGGSHKTPEDLGETVLDTLKDEDFDNFEKFVATPSDLKWIIEKSDREDSWKEKELKELDDFGKRALEVNKENFERTLKAGEEAGIKWSKVKFVDVDYDIEKERGIESADIIIVLEYKESKYRVKIDDCLKTKRGWVTTDGLRWKG